MLKNWDVQDVGYSGFGVLGCGLFKMWYVWNVGCLARCGMLICKIPGDSNTSKVLSERNLIYESS